MTFDHIVVLAEGNDIGRLAYSRDGWDWRCGGCSCGGCSTTSEFFLSASAALADFEAHVERRHP